VTKWIRPQRVRRAIAALAEWRLSAKSQPAMHLWPLLALVEKGVDSTSSVPFSEADDFSFWDRYARFPGDTRPGKVEGEFTADFYIEPLLREAKPADYPHRSPATIRTRTFVNSWSAATISPGALGQEVRLAQDFAEVFERKVLHTRAGIVQVPVVDLAVWLFREDHFKDEAGAADLESRFRLVFPFDTLDYARLFRFEQESAIEIFTSSKPTDDELKSEIMAALTAKTPPFPSPEQLAETFGKIEDDDPVLQQVKELLGLSTSGIILRGCPGTGKTWYAKQIALALTGRPDNVFEVQFHPSIGYEDFVEGYTPAESSKSGFEVVEKTFLKACRRAHESEQLIVVVIDEINRGDPARVFGELLTYLETGYRGQQFVLPYSQKDVAIPPNLLVLGTMNPHDRSITQLDQALVRRFDHIDLLPSSALVARFLESNSTFSTDQIDQVCEWFDAVQDLVPLGLGHTYFKDVKTPESLRAVWKYRIWPFCVSVLELEVSRLEDLKASFEGMLNRVLSADTEEPPA